MPDGWVDDDNIANPLAETGEGGLVEDIPTDSQALGSNLGSSSNNNDNVPAPQPATGNNNPDSADAVGSCLAEVNIVRELLR